MRGSSKLGPRTAVPTPGHFEADRSTSLSQPADATRHVPQRKGKLRVVFVCIGNSCRSQMAESFAKAYGGDIIDAASAGVSPAPDIAPLTQHIVRQKNFSMDGQFPKGLETITHKPADLIVNMSGIPLTMGSARTVTWKVQDPIGHQENVFRRVADEIEQLVMRLILELRAQGQ